MAVIAHGRPLITTFPQEPAPELVHGENVWLVPAGDVTSLSESINVLAGDADLRHRLGAGASAAAELFTWDGIAAETAAFFGELPEPRS